MTLPSEELRCMFTRNLCGTDTHMLGHPCECVNCRVSAQMDTLLARIAELEENLDIFRVEEQADEKEINQLIAERDHLKEELKRRRYGCCCVLSEDQEEVLEWCAIHGRERDRLKEENHALESQIECQNGIIDELKADLFKRGSRQFPDEFQELKDDYNNCVDLGHQAADRIERLEAELEDEKAGRPLLAKATDRINDLEAELAEARKVYRRGAL